MALDLRPLTLAELLDRSFSVYRQHFWLFVGIMAVPSVFGLASGILLQVMSVTADWFATGKPPTPEQMLAFIVPFLLGIVLFTLTYMLVYVFALGATTVAVSDLYLGRPVSIGSAYAETRRHVVRLLLLILWTMLRAGGVLFGGLALMAGLAALLGTTVTPVLGVLFMLIGIPAAVFLFLFVMLRYAVTVPALLLERLTAGGSIRRSVALTRGNLLRVLVLWVCAAVIAYATALLFQGPFMVGGMIAGEQTAAGFWVRIAGLVSGAIGGTFSAPFMIISLALFYYDVRIRKEAFDLQHMLKALEPPPAAIAVPAES
jgi:glycerophosphoryl diester phosphodiesterase family protein